LSSCTFQAERTRDRAIGKVSQAQEHLNRVPLTDAGIGSSARSSRLASIAAENQFMSKFGLGDNCENTFTTLPEGTEQEAKIEETRRIEEEGSTPGEVKMGL